MKAFTGTPVDYSRKKYWLAQPDHPDKSADLIYLYPSSCFDPFSDVICGMLRCATEKTISLLEEVWLP